MILSDTDLKKIIVDNNRLIVNPFNIDDLQPNSIDLHLDNKLKRLDGVEIDISDDDYILKPNEFLLGSTLEQVAVPMDLVAHIDGKSSLGRLGVFVHVSSGFVDSGFMGNLTLEIYNCSNQNFRLKFGESICQIIFETLTSPVTRPYGHEDLNSHYQNSDGVVNSKYEY